MTGKKVLENMKPYKPGMQASEVKEKYNLERIVKLASNENPYGYSGKVKEAMETMADDFELYPDGYAGVLREKLANQLHINPDQLVFGAGSDEIITFICRAFLSDGKNTVMATPTFPQYRHHALIEGAEVKEIATINGHHNLDKMLSAIDDHTEVVWLCTPDNPTGSKISEADIHRFMESCPKNVAVVLDAAYFEFMDDEDQYDAATLIDAYDNLIVLRTFSKIYGLAGFRAGYAISNETIATKLNVVRGPFNMSILSQRVALAALDDTAFLSDTRKKNNQTRKQFETFLGEIGWSFYPSVTNFLLVKTPIEANKAAEFLLSEGFIVRSGDLLGYPKTLRITIGTEKDMDVLQQVILKLDKNIKDGVMK